MRNCVGVAMEFMGPPRLMIVSDLDNTMVCLPVIGSYSEFSLPYVGGFLVSQLSHVQYDQFWSSCLWFPNAHLKSFSLKVGGSGRCVLFYVS